MNDLMIHKGLLLMNIGFGIISARIESHTLNIRSALFGNVSEIQIVLLRDVKK